MTNASVIPYPARRMNEAEYDRQRQRIRTTYGDSNKEAGARWEQEMALLFAKSGWTQQELATKEGKTRQWVAQRLCFGKFLTFAENATTSSNLSDLTETRFRVHWNQTESDARDGTEETRRRIEQDRFRKVLRLLEESASRQQQSHNSPINNAIREQFADGRWHASSTIAQQIGAPQPEVERALELMSRRISSRYNVERRQRGTGSGRIWQYQVHASERSISSSELKTKLTPIIQELRTQGRTNMATVSIPTIASMASQLQQLLDEWCR